MAGDAGIAALDADLPLADLDHAHRALGGSREMLKQKTAKIGVIERMVLFTDATVPTPFPIADPATTTNASEESACALFSDLPALQAWLAQWASACQLKNAC